jgi:PAS domain S-box-containing protein
LVDVTVLFCYIGALFALSFASVIGIGYVWIRIPRPPRARGVTASLLLLANAIWTAGVALEMLSTDLNSKIFWHVVQFSAMQTVPTLWLVYVLQYAGRQKWLTIRTYALLSVAPCATSLLALTNEFHGLVFARLAMDSMDPLMPLQEKFGLWVLGGLFYVSVLVAITSYVSIQMLVRSRQIYRRQSVALLLTLSLPWLAFAVYALEPGLLPVSLAPLVSAMAGTLFLMVNPSRLQVLDVVPVAHRVIIDGMSDPVFVLNEQGRIMQLNPAAEQLISSPAETSIGKQMEAILPQWSAFAEAPQKEQKETRELVIGDDTYDARSSQIVDWRGRLTSQIWVLRNITEDKRMERELRQSEERYRLIAENMTETIWLMDMHLKPTYISPSAVPLRGYTLEELYALPLDRQLTPDSLRLAWETFKDALSEENLNSKDAPTSITLELEFYRKDGSTFWNESTFTLVRNSKGEPAGILGVGREITERKRAEDALRRRAEELAALQATVLDITSRHDLAVLLETIVERAARLLRVSSGGMYLCDPQKREARCVVAYRTPYSIKGTVLKYGEGAAGTVAETGKPLLIDDYRTWEGRAVAYEQTKPFIAVLGVPVIWQGQVMGVIDVLDNRPQHFTKADQELLTLFANHAAIAIENARLMEQEKRHAEELTRYSTSLEQLVFERTGKLAESERRFRELADLLPQIVFETDEKGNFVFLNRVGFTSTGYSEKQIRDGLSAFQMFPPEDAKRGMENMARILNGQSSGPSEYMILRKDGSTFPALIHSSQIIQSGKPVGLRGLVIDITERKQMEARLAESQRLATIGETTAMVGHDLRNPLQGIVSTIYLAKRKLESPLESSREAAVKPGLVDMLETIENEAEYMDKIVSDLQDYAAPLKTEPKPVEMEPLVKDTLSKTRIPQNVKVSFKVSKPLPTVIIDPAVMRRVFSNLIMNAIQAMPDGGGLEIDMYGTDESMFIAFKDTGMGIPEENMGKLFNPFFTTKAKGQGLGLPVCKKLVEAQNGWITVESKLGAGSTFTVKLPIIKP